MRRQGSRWGRSRSRQSRILDRVKGLKALGLSDVKALERPSGTPSSIEFGCATRSGQPSRVVVASRRDGLDLLGWGYVAASLTAPSAAGAELLIIAPSISGRTRRAAERFAEGRMRIRLIAAPSLAENAGETGLDQESFPHEVPMAWGRDPQSMLERVLRVIEGAATVSSGGGLRRTPNGLVLFLRGVPVLNVVSEGDSATVNFTAPERRNVHVSPSNFARWGPDLHKMIVDLARDSRLAEDERSIRAKASEQAAQRAGCGLVGLWLPWDDEGTQPIDWVGTDRSGRPVLGVLRSSPQLGDLPAWMAGLQAFYDERSLWAPQARGEPRLLISTDALESKLADILSSAGIEFETQEIPAVDEKPERERRGRRRTRRRRRGRGEEGEARTSREDTSESADESSDEGEDGASEETWRRRPPLRARGPERHREVAGDTLQAEEDPVREERISSELAQNDDVAGSEEKVEAAWAKDQEPEAEEESERRPDAVAAAPAELEPEPDEESDAPSDPVEIEIEATLAEEEPEEEETPEPEEEPVRRRNPRAAVVVHNDPDSVLAGFVLARDRRNLVSFWVCTQDGLMDFFKGPATDIQENVDLLMVGFTVQPAPHEVIPTAELFRGRIQWFDHHEWPIEDLERLRDAIGRNSISIESGAATPLAAVVSQTERRSRFTDKLVDFSGRRLSENDMQKWGYRVAGLVTKLAGSPGEYRADILPVLSGKASELPEAEAVYQSEENWLTENNPRVVHFGEYQMTVLRVPSGLDPGEIGRRSRLRTGARLSLTSREGDDVVMLACNEERRHINVLDMVDLVSGHVPWARPAVGGDRVGRLRIEDLSEHPERIETVIGEIAKHRSVLYG